MQVPRAKFGIGALLAGCLTFSAADGADHELRIQHDIIKSEHTFQRIEAHAGYVYEEATLDATLQLTVTGKGQFVQTQHFEYQINTTPSHDSESHFRINLTRTERDKVLITFDVKDDYMEEYEVFLRHGTETRELHRNCGYRITAEGELANDESWSRFVQGDEAVEIRLTDAGLGTFHRELQHYIDCQVRLSAIMHSNTYGPEEPGDWGLVVERMAGRIIPERQEFVLRGTTERLEIEPSKYGVEESFDFRALRWEDLRAADVDRT